MESRKQRNKLGVLFSPPAMHASTWGDWVSGLSVGARAEDPVPHPALPQLLLVPAWGVTAPSCCQPTQKQGWGLGFPQSLAPKVLGHSRRHSLASSAVPRAHGRSWKKGRQRSQSVPVVLCWHRQASRPSPSGPHSLACPLHLHLGKEHGGRASATWGRRQQRKG